MCYHVDFGLVETNTRIRMFNEIYHLRLVITTVKCCHKQITLDLKFRQMPIVEKAFFIMGFVIL